VNDLDVELSDETLNQLSMEDALTGEMDQLSLNALAGTEVGDSMRIRALVHNKVMLILVDSGSSHSFVSQSFVLQAGLHTTDVIPMKVKVANGETILSDQYIPALEWWAQGFTFYTDMRVLHMVAYDAVLGYDWLRTHSPMICHWKFKALEFIEGDQHVHLEGVKKVGSSVSSISLEQLVKWQKGNDIWAMVVVH
jgi:hypothetical protein